MDSYLLRPLMLGHLQLKNRMIVPAMLTEYANPDGSLSERYIRYYEQRARGGFALLVTEDNAVSVEGCGYPCLPGIWNDELLPEHRQLVERVHAHGAAIMVQLYHAGREASQRVTGQTPLAPSPIPDPTIGELPHEMSRMEIKAMIACFVAAARRAHAAGYDGVELHAAHGYLINQFLSPFSNRRTDEYGGTEENRCRFLLEIIRRIRAEFPSGWIIGCKLSVDEFVEGGLRLPDSQRIALALQEAGVDVITASGSVYKSGFENSVPYYCPVGRFAHLAAGLKEVLTIPVVAINRINTPEVAEQILRRKQADLIAFGRASIADPELPLKLRTGRTREIISCISCNLGCLGRITSGLPVSCLVNPRTGRENPEAEERATSPRRVIVVGGGIAGMQAAITAAERGHTVILYEREESLGGVWRFAAIPPCKEVFLSFLIALRHRLEAAGVTVRLNCELTERQLMELRPDILICATGSTPKALTVSGIEAHPNVVSAIDLLRGTVEYGKEVVVVGGGMVGAETAEHLAVHGARVTLLARHAVARGLYDSTRHYLLASLQHNQVAVWKNVDLLRVAPRRVYWRERESGVEHSACADQIVVALGAVSNPVFADWAERHQVPCVIVGDARKIGDGVQAVLEGDQAGRSV